MEMSAGDSRKILKEYKCKASDEIFKLKPEFMKHRRDKHIESVPLCRDASKGRCTFGKLKCWLTTKNLKMKLDMRKMEPKLTKKLLTEYLT